MLSGVWIRVAAAAMEGDRIGKCVNVRERVRVRCALECACVYV